MSVDVLRLSFSSPLGTSFFLFPFLFFPIVPAASRCGITWSKDGVQKGHGGWWGGAEHGPLGSALPTAPALSRIFFYGSYLSTCRDFRNFGDQWFLYSCHSCSGEFLISWKNPSSVTWRLLLCPRPKVIFLSKCEFSVGRVFPGLTVSSAVFCLL